MTTAFVLSGGANLGAVQVGMLRALDETGVRPDVLVGSSVGAINAAWLAGADPADGVEGLADAWRSIRRSDVFPFSLRTGLSGFLGHRASLFDIGRLKRIIRRNIAFDRLEDAPIPLHVVVSDVIHGRDVRLASGDAVEVIAASSAIPGVYRPIEIDGRLYMDGGVINNTPVSHAVDLGADTVYVLPTGYACSLHEAPKSALGMTLHAVSLMVNRRLSLEIEHISGAVDLRVIPTPCPLDIGPTEFDRADELMDRAYETASIWLRSTGTRPINTIRAHVDRHSAAR